MAITSPAIVSRGNSYRLNPRAIVRREGWNPRNVDMGDIEGLSHEIHALDVLLPLRVKKLDAGKFELIDGHRRLTAVELLMETPAGALHWESVGVPVTVVDPKQDDKTSLLQALGSNRGKPLLPLEEADAFRRLKSYGMTNEAISKATGRSLMTLNASLALLESASELQSAVTTGKVKVDLGRKIAVAARGNKEKQVELTKAAVAAGKDKKARRAVVAQVEAARVEKAAAKGKELAVKPLTADALSTLGAKVAAQLQGLLKELGLEAPEGMMARVAQSNELAAIYSMGALDALKAAAGIKISLTV